MSDSPIESTKAASLSPRGDDGTAKAEATAEAKAKAKAKAESFLVTATENSTERTETPASDQIAHFRKLMDDVVLCAMASGDDYAVDSDPAENHRSLAAARRAAEEYVARLTVELPASPQILDVPENAGLLKWLRENPSPPKEPR